MVLLLWDDRLLEVDLVEFEEGGLEVVEFWSFFEEVVDLLEGLCDLLWVFVDGLGLSWLEREFGGFFVEFDVFMFDDLFELGDMIL